MDWTEDFSPPLRASERKRTSEIFKLPRARISGAVLRVRRFSGRATAAGEKIGENPARVRPLGRRRLPREERGRCSHSNGPPRRRGGVESADPPQAPRSFSKPLSRAFLISRPPRQFSRRFWIHFTVAAALSITNSSRQPCSLERIRSECSIA
ncbi:hypothetical protein SKAU_G00125180 [Synaphobranchus kaupii]|uniref:Uncharacterized protein n=1 Tax=Synaphobranchus kaupii TaxID=118154 RepID=A0A9Q1FQ96_SYNKA|nr:hypothetical protein SKAU_G00125180 [Synaphobranchus kaupii]